MTYNAYLRERHQAFSLTVPELHTWIEEATSLYEETRSERALRFLQTFQAKLESIRDAERVWVELDFQEILAHPAQYPHSVVTWAYGYRDKEIS